MGLEGGIMGDNYSFIYSWYLGCFIMVDWYWLNDRKDKRGFWKGVKEVIVRREMVC